MPFSDQASQAWLDGLPSALEGTLAIWAVSATLGIVIGVLLAFARLSSFPILSSASRFIVDVGRSVPLIVVLYLAYFGILAFGFPIDPFYAACAAIGTRLAFLLAEVFRAGIQSVPAGYVEAARSLGMRRVTLVRRVVLPIAVRIMLPTIGQYVVGALLDSSFASVIGGVELTQHSRVVIDIMFAEQIWLYVAATYLILTFPISRGFSLLERRWAMRL